ncbi:hypothetical protein [Deinococcus yavapaiensis]|uniref:Uncharacterized protein n=1 Tax=Deinococcus yavapaiensis KR-236 TaxID=694435 RepID=A0A318SBS2_9DEIO|nr:hypothetical protein [Deinococcus yavapaiensis]PYE54197.1 hypothetical protein DES52_106163 [Deinococcus yavapaiensis KR-236]
MKPIIFTALLLLGAASAEVTPTPTPPSAVTPQQRANLSAFVSLVQGGATVEFLDSSDAVVATLNADGTLSVAQDAKLDTVKSVRVTTPGQEGAEPTTATYVLASRLDQPGQLRVTVTGPNGKIQTIGAPAAINRAAPSSEDRAQPAPQPQPTPSEPSESEQEKGGSGNNGKGGGKGNSKSK